jgi:membrane protein DedA with SNARE-associated domain
LFGSGCCLKIYWGENKMEWLKKIIASGLATSILRKILTLLSGWLLATVPDVGAETIAQFVESAIAIITALIPYLIAQLWSIAAKAKK